MGGLRGRESGGVRRGVCERGGVRERGVCERGGCAREGGV